MQFKFSIRNALKEAWMLFANRPWFFIALSLVMAVLNFAKSRDNVVLTVVVLIAAIIWSYVFLSVSLAAVKGQDSMLHFSTITKHIPTPRQFFSLTLIGIANGIIIVIGLICLIIPGIYLAMRLAFSNLSYVDRQQGISATLRRSWHLVKGSIFWTVLLTSIVAAALIVVGALAFGVGILVTYPLAMLLMALLYRALSDFETNALLQEQPKALKDHVAE